MLDGGTELRGAKDRSTRKGIQGSSAEGTDDGTEHQQGVIPRQEDIRSPAMTTDDPRRPQACSAGRHQQDRRDFLKVAVTIPATLVTTQTVGADAPAPADATSMPQIRLGDYSISRLIVGCHNIDGGSHMSPFLDKEMHDYYTPERAVQTLRRCEEVGINAWQGHERGTLL